MSDLHANWPAPDNISALTTVRVGGFSVSPFESNNMGLHVNDDPDIVRKNRAFLANRLAFPGEPIWLEQIHSNHCILAEQDSNRIADAAISRSKACVLAIMTADCLPILLCDMQGTEIAAIHSGWKGMANGIIENTLAKMTQAPNQLMAWIGPGICKNCYEVGQEVRTAYTDRYAYTERAFRKTPTRWYADLPHIAELILKACGVASVYHSAACTYEMKKAFYSYRREQQTGRMASLIWFNR